MNPTIVLLLTGGLLLPAPAISGESVTETNKRLAREFYEDLWFSPNTDRYEKYMADTYIAHDTGDRKNVREPAVEQKHIADFFWNNGEMSGQIDYQIAEGDLVATRWHVSYEPKTLLGRILMSSDRPLPIINVFRFQDGRIVELWNHRHDIDTGQTYPFVLKGFLVGLLVSLIPLAWALRLRKKLKLATPG